MVTSSSSARPGKGNLTTKRPIVETYGKWGPDGSIAWKIERADEIGGEHDPYTGLWREGDEIWAYNFNGLAYHVDTETGELGKTREMK